MDQSHCLPCNGNQYKDHAAHPAQLLLRRLGRYTVSFIKPSALVSLIKPPILLLVITTLVCWNLKITSEMNRKLDTKIYSGSGSVRASHADSVPSSTGSSPKLQAWIRANHLETGYLKHVSNVLESLQYSMDGGTYSDWTLLWSHEYPFIALKDTGIFKHLKPYQKVNKWPGSGYVTSKVQLAKLPIDSIPKAFKMPDEMGELRRYVADNPDTYWVQKSNAHRGIKIVPVSGLDLTRSNTFVQKYVDKPLLIDGRKFDIGVYTIITSMKPLRIYIVDHDFLLRKPKQIYFMAHGRDYVLKRFTAAIIPQAIITRYPQHHRFCAHDYHPFDPKDNDKYVVTDDYTPIWQIPSLSKYFNGGFNSKQSFKAYMASKNMDSSKVLDAIDHTIRSVYLNKLSNLRQSLEPYNNKNFFEMVRFDFILDDEARLYLMEVNMSPNLSSHHFAPNQQLYEQVLYNLFHVTGIASPLLRTDTLSEAERDMIGGPRDISADPEYCATTCFSGCDESGCHLCYSCMNMEEKSMYKEAYLEHVNRRNTRRVMPPTLVRGDSTVPPYWTDLPKEDQQMHRWFQGRCDIDGTWC